MMPRPAGHWTKTGKLSSKATPWPSVKPDADKLLRAVGDALTGVLIEDDARVVNIAGSKRYCVGDEPPGAIITIIPL
jgi:crossover junction endodeoxyribonuclease RusA